MILVDKPKQSALVRGRIALLLSAILITMFIAAGSVSAQSVFQAESQLSHLIGRADGVGWSANVAQDSEGWLCYGPYTTAFNGKHRATFRMMIDQHVGSNDLIARIEVFDTTSGVIVSRDIYRSDFLANSTYQDFSLDYTSSSGHTLEFRTYWYDKAYINEDCVTVSDLPTITQLPDPFLMNNGVRTSTVREWQQRREEIKNALQLFEYGHMPPAPLSWSLQPLFSESWYGGTKTTCYMHLNVDASTSIIFTMLITVPPGSGPFPVVVYSGDYSQNAAVTVPRGYMLVTCVREDLDLDNVGSDTVGPAQAAYPGYDWGSLSVWAWELSRVMDYLETRSDVQIDHVIVRSHSRGGKVALLAGALDERFAMVAPNCAGTGGPSVYRIQNSGSETLAAITDPTRFYYWFQKDFGQFANQETKLLFDQHFLDALVAPRLLLTTDVIDDLWANPLGNQASREAAKHVFGFLGVGGNIGMHFRSGVHDDTYEDLNAVLDYADLHWFGIPSTRDFNYSPYPSYSPTYTWNTPSCTVETVPPTGSITINSGADYTSSASVTLTLSATDTGSGVYRMAFRNAGTSSWSAWEPYATSKAWTLTSGDGPKAVLVRFEDTAGNSSITYSDSIGLDTAVPTTPGTPTDAGAYTQSTSVMFNWTASSDTGSGIAGYNCQIGTTPGASDVFSGYVGNVLSKSVTGWIGVTLYCRVQAKDNAGNLSAWSANSDGIMVDYVVPTTPGTPTDTGAYTNSTSVTFNWTASSDTSSGIAGYNCQISTTPGGSDVFNGDVGNVLSKSVTGCLNGTTYYCRVQAKDKAGNLSSWSGSSDGILVDAAVPTTPGVPTDAGTYTQSTSLTFNWTASTDSGSGLAGYNCQIGTTPGGSDVFSGYVGNLLSKSVTGCLNGSTYYCRVQAKDNAVNVSSWSGNSNGITVVTNAGVSLAAARQLLDSATVGLSGKVVTGIFGDCLYIQEPNRIAGIRVVAPTVPSGIVIGSMVDVGGTLMTNAAGERYIAAGAIEAGVAH